MRVVLTGGRGVDNLNTYIAAYKKQVQKGDIVKAYRGLMDAMTEIKNRLAARHPDHIVPGGLYTGYMDMTYFSFTPKDLYDRKLKIAIVFVHETGRFEAWLAAGNREIRAGYERLFRDGGWDKTPVTQAGKGVDAILEKTLADDPDFDHLDALAAQIENGVMGFKREIQEFLNGKG